jgi:hypothetical protein
LLKILVQIKFIARKFINRRKKHKFYNQFHFNLRIYKLQPSPHPKYLPDHACRARDSQPRKKYF